MILPYTKHVVPASELQVVRGYKLVAHYASPTALAFLSQKDRSKRQTYRVRVEYPGVPAGQPDEVRHFYGTDALWKAMRFAKDSVTPPLTPEQLKDMF